MQLSKQEFSKLPQSERNKLMKLKAKGNAPPKKSKKKKSPAGISGRQNSGKQASVAAAYATRNLGKAPAIKSSRDTCNIKHREFIGNVQGSAAFTVGNTFSVNPGLRATFPWLSIMAQAWEEYRFRSLRFCYYTRTGSNTQGSVMMAPDYDASDDAPATEFVLSSYDEVVEDAPWKDMCCVLKANLMSGAGGRRHFVRSGALAPNQDIKLYDVARFFVGTVDGAAVSWGKLWVEYDIDFYIPQLPPAGALQVSGGRFFGGGTISLANPMGDAPTGDPDNVGIAIGNNSTITFETPGSYIVEVQQTGTALLTLPLAAGVNSVVTNIPVAFPNAAGTQQHSTWLVVTSTANGTAVLTSTGTSATAAAMFIGTVPPRSQN